jgi:glycosyltransferase involved in cell wall biosynthesis
MKVLLANKFFYLNGGSERVFFQEREFLKDQGVPVVDYSMEDARNLPSNQSEFFAPHVGYVSSSGIGQKIQAARSFIHSSEAVRRLRALVIQERPEIAHLHNIYHQLTPSIIPMLKRLGVNVVLTLHDGKLVCPSYLMLNKGKLCLECAGKHFHLPFTFNCQQSRVAGALLSLEAYYHAWKKSYDGVDAFIVPSQFLGDVVAPRIGRDRTHLLQNGIDHNAFEPSSIDRGYILYVGRLSAEKGVETLLKAHVAMKHSVPLVIIGTGPMEESLRAQASSLVTFAGYCSGDSLWNKIRESSCLVVPSECYENAPMTVLEGMAFAKSVVASRIGGIPEQVVHEETGILFEPGNVQDLACALDSIMANADMRKKMGLAGRARLEREFTLETHNHKLLSLYESLLK